MYGFSSQMADYQFVAASQANKKIQGTNGQGLKGDILVGLIITPLTTSPGTVQIKDGANTAITLFAGGVASVADLKPIVVPLSLRSVDSFWQVTTGANVTVVAFGRFQ